MLRSAAFSEPAYPKRKAMWPWVVGALVAVVLGLCSLGVYALGSAAPSGSASATAPTTYGVSPSSQGLVPHPGVRPSIKGDDLVHVGEDVAAGTYRAATPVLEGQSCYWLKSSDAEGSHIIENGLPAGGRPQVTLKKGQWFTSRDCPDWLAQ